MRPCGCLPPEPGSRQADWVAQYKGELVDPGFDQWCGLVGNERMAQLSDVFAVNPRQSISTTILNDDHSSSVFMLHRAGPKRDLHQRAHAIMMFDIRTARGESDKNANAWIG